ncbi:MAG: hypothetical protein GXO58_07415 [Thermodesulfobacteria bacterium]|nr:hypothetical protein [Thermodesulfobacteriota bacterium]
MVKQDVAILFSGGRDSLALYALAMAGYHPEIQRPRKIHLIHMLNGMARFPEFPKRRFEKARDILVKQVPDRQECPESTYVELDMGRLFQGLWLDTYEILMPKFGGKNLVCVACKLGMHAKAIIYCVTNYVPLLLAGYASRQAYYPEQTPVFMERMEHLSQHFGISTKYPIYSDFQEEDTARHLLEDFGLPSTGGGERKCMFCQTLTTAGPEEIGAYLDEMIPKIQDYIEFFLSGKIRKAAEIFPPGNKWALQG